MAVDSKMHVCRFESNLTFCEVQGYTHITRNLCLYRFQHNSVMFLPNLFVCTLFYLVFLLMKFPCISNFFYTTY